jgi:hypothetical protein
MIGVFIGSRQPEIGASAGAWTKFHIERDPPRPWDAGGGENRPEGRERVTTDFSDYTDADKIGSIPSICVIREIGGCH